MRSVLPLSPQSTENRMRVLVTAATLLTSAAYLPARAQDAPPDLAACLTAPLAAKVETCSQVIDTARYFGRRLAILYAARGDAHLKTGWFDGALEDLAEAIAIDPTFDDHYWKRAGVHESLADTARAIADYDAAIRIRPHAERYVA